MATSRTGLSYGGMPTAPASPLERLAAEPGQAALLLDVDGVLAPIVDVPSAATVSEETRAELRRLHGRYGLVACVSGRAGEDAARVVGVPELTYVGEHGLELAPEAEAWRERLHAFAAGLSWEDVERKPLTVTLHYRRSDDPGAAEQRLAKIAEEARGAGLVPRFGRKVLELRPPVEADKGTAVRVLLERAGLRRALYAGDDTTDLDAFRALDGLELAVRVAVSSDEGPEKLREAADLVVGDPAELLQVLRSL
jgi:trehalose 6-phosphate phosphatase